MAVSITVPINFGRLTSKLKNLDLVNRVPTEALNLSGPLLVGLSKLTFRDSADPYGVPWAPLKSRDGKPLLDSGNLRNSINFKVAASVLRIGPNVGYGAIHQTGGTTPARVITPKNAKALAFKIGGVTVFAKKVNHPGSKIPRRAYLPDERGLPDDWRDVLKEQFETVVKRHLAG
ncbi:MAG: phage virion morphogenesis protein [Betaproteobacteria bacterium]